MEFAPTQYGKTTITSFWHKNDHGRLPTYTIRSCRNGAAGSLGTGVCGTKNNNHVDSLGLDVKHVQEFNWLQSRLIGGVFLDSSDNRAVRSRASSSTRRTRRTNTTLARRVR